MLRRAAATWPRSWDSGHAGIAVPKPAVNEYQYIELIVLLHFYVDYYGCIFEFFA